MRDHFFSTVISAIALAVASVPALADPVGKMPDTRRRGDDEPLRQALQDIRQRHEVPGLAAAVFDRESIRAFGTGELAADGNPVTPESRFRVGQVGTLFTAMAMATLVSDGSIPPDAPLRRLAPELDVHNPWSGERPVRVADVLSHRAGLGALHFRDVYSPVEAQPLLASINSAFRALRLEYRPGEREQYSIIGPAIAAYLIEKAAGFPHEDVLQRMFFEPLETSASVGRGDDGLPGDAQGHAGWPARALPATPMNFQAAGGIWISAEGLARAGQVLVNRGHRADRQVMPAEAVHWLEASANAEAAIVPGYRNGVRVEESNGFLFYTLTGALPGFLARFAYSPELGGGYVVLLNHGGARQALAAADALLRGQLMNGSRPAAPLAPAAELQVSALQGWYRKTDAEPPQRALYGAWTGLARVASCGRNWCFSRPGQTVVLEPFDAQHLREEGRWYPGWELHAGEAGVVLAGAEGRWQRVPRWQALGGLAVAAFIMAGVLAAAVMLPAWTVSLRRRRVAEQRDRMVELVPLVAAAAAVSFQVLLFTTDYPALGTISSAGIAILVLSIATPLLAVLATAAAAAGFFWRLPLRTTIPAAFIACAAVMVSVAMIANGLFAFQPWNY